jgi:hypothetical protein
LSGLKVTPDSAPGKSATGDVSRTFPPGIHSLSVLAIFTALESGDTSLISCNPAVSVPVSRLQIAPGLFLNACQKVYVSTHNR